MDGLLTTCHVVGSDGEVKQYVLANGLCTHIGIETRSKTLNGKPHGTKEPFLFKLARVCQDRIVASRLRRISVQSSISDVIHVFY